MARSHRLPPEGLGGSRSAGGGPAGAGSAPDPLLLGLGDEARHLLASVSESVSRDTGAPGSKAGVQDHHPTSHTGGRHLERGSPQP